MVHSAVNSIFNLLLFWNCPWAQGPLFLYRYTIFSVCIFIKDIKNRKTKRKKKKTVTPSSHRSISVDQLSYCLDLRIYNFEQNLILYTLNAYMYNSTNQYIKDEHNWLSLTVCLEDWWFSTRWLSSRTRQCFFSQNLHEKIEK